MSSLTEHEGDDASDGDDEVNPMILNQRQLAEKIDKDPKHPVLAAEHTRRLRRRMFGISTFGPVL